MTGATAAAPHPADASAVAAAAVAAANAGYYAAANAWPSAPKNMTTPNVSTIPVPPLPTEYQLVTTTAAAPTTGVADPMMTTTTTTMNPLTAATTPSHLAATNNYIEATPTPENIASTTALAGSATASMTTSSGRSLRKRTLREASDGGGLGVMAAAVGAVSSGGGRSNKSRRKSGASTGSDASSNERAAEQASSKGTSGGGSSNNDGRWSKRFSWPEELHRDFVAAIFDVGLKHSSPSTLLEQMPKHEQITTERIKSHLQKYRLHRVKSKKEFMASYDASLKRFQSSTSDGATSLSGGQVAGHLAFKSMESSQTTATTEGSSDPSQQAHSAQPSPVPVGAVSTSESTSATPVPTENDPQHQGTKSKGKKTVDSIESSTPQQQDTLMFPRLTELEKKSPIGAAMGYLMGLFFSLKQQLMAQRVAEVAAVEAAAAATKQQQNSNVPVAAVYNSFVSGQPSSILSTAPAPGESPAVVLDPLNTAATAAGSSTPANNPSTRTNLEENTIMKREMNAQMLFQTKMRALKQQELDKYSSASTAGHSKPAGGSYVPAQSPLDAVAAAALAQHPAPTGGDLMPPPAPVGGDGTSIPNPVASPAAAGATTAAAGSSDEQQGPQQTLAPGAAVGGRNRGMSLGGPEDFWNTDVVDDQLFEFLMSDG